MIGPADIRPLQGTKIEKKDPLVIIDKRVRFQWSDNKIDKSTYKLSDKCHKIRGLNI